MKVINKKASKGTWVKYPKDKSIELLVRPLSIYDFDKLPSEDMEITPKEFGKFCEGLLVDWKGFVDEDGKALKCTDENKRILSDHDQEIAAFVINTAAELKSAVVTDTEIKN